MEKSELKMFVSSMISAEKHRKWTIERLIEQGFTNEQIERYEISIAEVDMALSGAKYLQDNYGVDINRRKGVTPMDDAQLSVAYENAEKVIADCFENGKIDEIERDNCMARLWNYFNGALFRQESFISEMQRKSQYFNQLSSVSVKIRSMKSVMTKAGFPIQEFWKEYYIEKGLLVEETVEQGGMKL